MSEKQIIEGWEEIYVTVDLKKYNETRPLNVGDLITANIIVNIDGGTICKMAVIREVKSHAITVQLAGFSGMEYIEDWIRPGASYRGKRMLITDVVVATKRWPRRARHAILEIF